MFSRNMSHPGGKGPGTSSEHQQNPCSGACWPESQTGFLEHRKLTLKVLITTIDAQWEGMGDVGSARYELALLPHARP